MMSLPQLGPWVWCGLAAWAALIVGTAAADDVGRVVAGVVVDEAGHPVPGATVESAGWASLEPGRTDAEGHFALAVPDPDIDLALIPLLVRAADGRLGYQPERFGATAHAPIRIALKPARPLAVRVVDAAGRPVAGAEVAFGAGSGWIPPGESAADGTWSTSVPTDAIDWKCFARKPGVGFDHAQARREPFLSLPAHLTLTLDGARPPVTVRAVGLHDEPLAGVRVGVWFLQKRGQAISLNFPGHAGLTATTGPDGLARLDWLPAQLTPGTAVGTASEKFSAIDSWVELPDGAREIKVAHAPMERIAGRVTDALGRPAAGVAVVATGRGDGSAVLRRTARTDPAGLYAFSAPSEMSYILTATRGDEAAPFRSGLVLRAGHALDRVDFRLGPVARLRGHATIGPGGRPAPHQQIFVAIDGGPVPPELERPGGWWPPPPLVVFFNAHTDADGRYEMRLGPGDYDLYGLPRGPRVRLTIPASHTPAEVIRNFVLPRPGDGTLKPTAIKPSASGSPGRRSSSTTNST